MKDLIASASCIWQVSEVECGDPVRRVGFFIRRPVAPIKPLFQQAVWNPDLWQGCTLKKVIFLSQNRAVVHLYSVRTITLQKHR